MTSFPEIPDLHDPVLAARLQHLLDHKTKPLGALGALEALALRIGCILGTDAPALHAPQLLVCAADHGLAAQGVSAYPSDVTWQMVENFLAGGAAVSVLARQHGIALTVADCGVAHVFDGAVPVQALSPPHPRAQPLPGRGSHTAAIDTALELLPLPTQQVVAPDLLPLPQGEGGGEGDGDGASPTRPRLVDCKVAPGTADASQGPAMTAAQCQVAMAHGMALVRALPGNVLLLGEMGIGNTSAASLLLARLADLPLADCIGAGTGLDAAGVQRKHAVLHAVAGLHAGATAPLDALAAFGGFEIAALAGAILQAAHERRVVLLDGFIAGAAALVAQALAPYAVQRCIASHCSAEPGHALLLQRLGLAPLLRLELRLGEGSGAALAWPLLESACRIVRDMASFASAGVSRAT